MPLLLPAQQVVLFEQTMQARFADLQPFGHFFLAVTVVKKLFQQLFLLSCHQAVKVAGQGGRCILDMPQSASSVWGRALQINPRQERAEVLRFKHHDRVLGKGGSQHVTQLAYIAGPVVRAQSG